MTTTPSQVAAFTDDELRLAVARKKYPNKPIESLCSRTWDCGYRWNLGFDPLSNEGAHKLMVENEIGVSFLVGHESGKRVYGRHVNALNFRLDVESISHPATEHGTN